MVTVLCNFATENHTRLTYLFEVSQLPLNFSKAIQNLIFLPSLKSFGFTLLCKFAAKYHSKSISSAECLKMHLNSLVLKSRFQAVEPHFTCLLPCPFEIPAVPFYIVLPKGIIVSLSGLIITLNIPPFSKTDLSVKEVHFALPLPLDSPFTYIPNGKWLSLRYILGNLTS